MKINTLQGFNIIRLIKKMGIKDDLVKIIGELTDLESKKDIAYNKLGVIITAKYENYDSFEDKEKEKIAQETLAENNILSKEIQELQNKEAKEGIELLTAVVDNIPNAENELYKTLADLFDKKETEIKKQDLDVTVKQVKEVISSPTFSSFFKLATN